MITAWMLAISGTLAPAPSISDGMRLFSEGQFPEAAEVFAAHDESGLAQYNQACALLEAGELAGAADQFRLVDRAFPKYSGSSRFNLGHVLLRMAQSPPAPVAGQETPPAPPDVLGLLRQSAAAFRSVLEVNPGDGEAARNTELVRRMIQQIEQTQQEQAERQKQMNEAADQLDQLADEQERQAEQSKSTPPSRAEQSKQEQEQLREDTAEQLEQMTEQMDDSPESRDAQQRVQEALNEQSEALQDLSEQRPDRASEAQQQATDRLREAAKKLREAASAGDPQPSDPDQSQQGGDQNKPPDATEPGEETAPKSAEEQLAEQIIEAEQNQREARDRMRRMLARPVPVERDW